MKLTKLLLAAPLMFLAVNGQVMAQDEHRFDVSAGNLFVPGRVATSGALRYDNGDFHLTLDGAERQVARYNVRGVPAGAPEEKLEEALKFGYFTVAGSEAEPMLQWKGRILGGVRNLGGSESVANTAGDLGGKLLAGGVAAGVGYGVKAGMAAGPWGVIVGGAVGGLAGAIVYAVAAPSIAEAKN